MTNDRSCPCRPGVLTVTSTGIAPFQRKIKSGALLFSLSLIFCVMLFGNAVTALGQAEGCQASGSVPIFPSTGTTCGTALKSGDFKNIIVTISNTSSTTTSLTPVTSKLTGTIVYTLACTNTTCTTQLPGTLTFVAGAVDGCVSHAAGVLSCSSIDANHVAITMTAGGVALPAGAANFPIATIRVQATTFTNTNACGQFGERADTGANDISTTDALCSAQATGGAQGSSNEFFPQCVVNGDCTPSTAECKTAVCTNNTCGTENKADSTACADTVSGDCKTAGCESGVCVQTHANVADSTACTSTSDVAGDCGTPGCESGVCVANHIPVADSTACSVGVTGTPSECATPGCESGVCVATHIPKSDSTPCTDSTPGDCKTAGCESGVCVQTHANVSDSTACTSTPDVAGDCGTPGCESGVCVANHISVSDSTPCSVGVTGTADECKTPGCESGVCVAAHINKADSTACTDTTPACGFTAGCEAGSCVQEHVAESCGQGCTPGFWKANADKKQSNAWPVDPNTKLGTVFTIPPCVSSCGEDFANLTLRQALSLQGGSGKCAKAEILLRVATGSFLNASSSCVQFNLNAPALVAEVNAVLASCDGAQFVTEASKLDGFNNQGCPIDQQGRCSNH